MAGIYENPLPAVTRLRLAIGNSFRQIRQEEGYFNTVGDVLYEIPSATKIATLNFPAVLLVRGRSEVPGMGNDLLDKSIPFLARAYLNESDDPALARELLVADFERKLGVNWMGLGEDGVETCRLARFEGDQPFGMVDNLPRIGFDFFFTVTFSQWITDPTVAS